MSSTFFFVDDSETRLGHDSTTDYQSRYAWVTLRLNWIGGEFQSELKRTDLLMQYVDTIDLQDPRAPSAQDHTRQPNRLNTGGRGPSPHQADALRHAEKDAADEQQRSPRVSWGDGDLQLESRPAEDSSIGQEANDGRRALDDPAARHDSPAEDVEMTDGEEDDGLDDDMMDKISSSPSIDDGGYHQSQDLPVQAIPSLPAPVTLELLSFQNSTGLGSSAPLMSTPPHCSDLSQRQEEDYHHHHRHLQGEDLGDHHDEGFFDAFDDLQESYEGRNEEFEPGELLESRSSFSLQDDLDKAKSWASPPSPLHDVSQVTTVHTTAEEDGDDDKVKDVNADDISFSTDTRFIDSGWGGECLRDTEDINFQFVYALHGFPATVDGQANASKGDTMILLDDRNSYWWLVRIVKDDSIGKCLVSKGWERITEMCLTSRVSSCGIYRDTYGKTGSTE